jgi:hypothetical protein
MTAVCHHCRLHAAIRQSTDAIECSQLINPNSRIKVAGIATERIRGGETNSHDKPSAKFDNFSAWVRFAP